MSQSRSSQSNPARGNDAEASSKSQFIADLFSHQSTPLVKYLTARFRSVDEAQEVAQEAWLRLYRLEKPETLDNAKAFLFQTASNLSIDRIRRQNLERKYQPDSEEVSQSVEASVEAQLALRQVEAALHELPNKCRQAFVMHRHKNLSYPNIAKELGVSTSMVEKYIIQALKHLRNKLAQESD
ncbi:MAG: RNA polymerase sigma factor [Pseudomonadota bacterium]